MSPGMFWRITPRKLDLLIRVHIDMNTVEDEKKQKPKQGFIDQIF
jgi:hypothetical protein